MKKTGLMMALLGIVAASCGDNGKGAADGGDARSDAKDADASPTDVPRADSQLDSSPTDTPRADTSPTDGSPSDQNPSDGPPPSFKIGGTVEGLTGSGLVLQDNAGDNLTVAANATDFTFAGHIAQGGAYAVTILTQPSAPAQTCSVSGGSGTVDGADITNIAITCTAQTFTIGGTISGLTGSGLVLRNNGGDNLTVSANAATFTFATAVPSGGAYAATILIQPSTPTQLCTVANGSGTVGSASVTNIAITCATHSFTVGGTISGLVGDGLTLRNNGGDTLILAPASTTFTFLTPVASNAAFAVTIFAQPITPSQTCTVSGGTGVMGAANVTSVVINCSAAAFTVGGTVNGLRGTLVLHNGSENQTVTTNGGFAFPTPIATAGTYAVSVSTQPSSPHQTCSVTNGSGSVAGANVTNVMVTCTVDAFHVRAAVTGLAGSGLVLRNGTDAVSVLADGTVTFSTPADSGTSYSVSVSIQPLVPTQTCRVAADGSGAIAGTDVTASVTCVTNTYRVRTTVTGLTGTGLVLNNGSDNVPVATDRTFNFPTPVASGANYSVTVVTQPSGQVCTVSPNTPTSISAADVTAIVTCVASTFTVTGTISNLSGGGLVLRNTRSNGTEDLPVGAGAPSFVFLTRVPLGGSFAVSVVTQPSGPPQICTIANASGTNVMANATNVAVTCVTQYSVHGTISNLIGSGLVLRDTRNNGTENLTITAPSFTFVGLVPAGGSYAVSVVTQPSAPPQICTIANASGMNVGANVTDVMVTCVTQYSVHGTISNLTGGGLVLHNRTEDLSPVAGATAFAFSGLVPAGGSYAVSVTTQPSLPPQICTIANASGTNVMADITDVMVTCVTQYSVHGMISNLTGGGLVLRDIRNSGPDEDITIAALATGFAFNVLVPAGGSYMVGVVTQPSVPPQICTIMNGSGMTVMADVTNVMVSCVTQYSVTGTISNLTGTTGLVLRNVRDDGTEDVTLATGAASFAFTAPVAGGGSYTLSVVTQPSAPIQICTIANASGMNVAANVIAPVTCVTQYTLGGTIAGYIGTGLALENNGADDLTVADGSTTFTFATRVPANSTFGPVTVSTQPTVPTPPSSVTSPLSQSCSVSPNTGPVGNANVTSVAVDCAVCAIVDEFSQLSLTCPAGQTIAGFDFVSYGRATGGCGGFATDPTCDGPTGTGTAAEMALAPCLTGVQSCTVNVDNNHFGPDPCAGAKHLSVQVRCH